jgi:hypothetical protein
MLGAWAIAGDAPAVSATARPTNRITARHDLVAESIDEKSFDRMDGFLSEGGTILGQAMAAFQFCASIFSRHR